MSSCAFSLAALPGSSGAVVTSGAVAFPPSPSPVPVASRGVPAVSPSSEMSRAFLPAGSGSSASSRPRLVVGAGRAKGSGLAARLGRVALAKSANKYKPN